MAPEVRVIGPEGEQLGVMSMQDAMRRAADFDVDVVETVATANPPVVRLIDYGKFKYQEQKREAEAKAKQTVIEVKEIKLRPGTDEGDYQVKMRNIKRFLEDGDKVKVTLRFRGREITHQEIGMAQLERIKTELGDLIVVESMPRLEGKQMVMMIAPGKKKGAASKPAAATVLAGAADSESPAAAPAA
jgi:translation initiation factor IF-3